MYLNLNLNEKYVIENYSYGFILKEKREVIDRKTNEPKQEWIDIGYYGKIGQLKNAILDNEISCNPKIIENIDFLIQLKRELLELDL